MAANAELADAVRRHLADWTDVDERRMFGGLGFMWRGHLLCGVMGDELLVRLGKGNADVMLGVDGAHLMRMGERTANGWVLVPVPEDRRDELIDGWIARAASFVQTLPAR